MGKVDSVEQFTSYVQISYLYNKVKDYKGREPY